MKQRPFVWKVAFLVLFTMVVLAGRWASAQTTKSIPASSLDQKLYKAALKEGTLEWWNSTSLREANIFIKKFNEKYPGIKINYFEGTASVMQEKYLAEHQAGRASADVLIPEYHTIFKERNLLTDLSDIIKEVNYPSELYTKDRGGLILEQIVSGVAYNTKLVSPKDVPMSWEDLLDPKWTGKLNVEDRLKVFVSGTEYWGEKWTVDYLKKLRNQKVIIGRGVSSVMTLLQAGEFPIAVSSYLHSVITAQKKGVPAGWAPINPAITGGTNATISPKTAPHPNTAKLFLLWRISPEGQALNDQIRFKSNPFPGTGTIPSRFLENLGNKVFSATEWLVDNDARLEKLYREAMGFRK